MTYRGDWPSQMEALQIRVACLEELLREDEHPVLSPWGLPAPDRVDAGARTKSRWRSAVCVGLQWLMSDEEAIKAGRRHGKSALARERLARTWEERRAGDFSVDREGQPHPCPRCGDTADPDLCPCGAKER